jgi:hypothetical protein
MRSAAVVFILLLLGAWGLRAQAVQGEHYYAGRLGDYMVYAVLLGGDEGPLQGRYFYESRRKEIDLAGRTQSGRITLEETVDGEATGAWRGERDNFSFRGTWTSPKGKELAYQLYPIVRLSYIEALQKRSLNDIQDKALRATAALFQAENLPFTVRLQGENDAEPLPHAAWSYFFADTSELFFYNELYAGQVFFQPDYFGLVSLHSYTPGAFGIYNDFTRLSTFRYDGRVISQLELGCYGCHDSNMGSGDYYATTDSCSIAPGRITCYRVDEHGSLDMEEGQESFLEITRDTLVFRLEADGAVVPE